MVLLRQLVDPLEDRVLQQIGSYQLRSSGSGQMTHVSDVSKGVYEGQDERDAAEEEMIESERLVREPCELRGTIQSRLQADDRACGLPVACEMMLFRPAKQKRIG